MKMLFIASREADFASALADLARRELDAGVMIGESWEPSVKADALVVDTALPGPWPDDAIRISKSDAPLPAAELLARIDSQFRNAAHDQRIDLSGVYFFPKEKALFNKTGQRWALTDKESQIVSLLAETGNVGMSREQLMTRLWGNAASELETHTLETHIYRLRGKLRECCGRDMVETTENGYRLAT